MQHPDEKSEGPGRRRAGPGPKSHNSGPNPRNSSPKIARPCPNSRTLPATTGASRDTRHMPFLISSSNSAFYA